MLGQSFGVFVDGPTCPTGPRALGAHQAFRRLFTTSVSWRSKPVSGHPVDGWVTDGYPMGYPLFVPAMSRNVKNHVEPFVQHQIPSHDGPNELRYFECLMDRLAYFLGSFGLCFPHFSQAIFGRRSSLVSSFGQVDVHDAEMLFHVLDDGLGSKRRAF